MKVPPFMPPMFGYQKIANFEVLLRIRRPAATCSRVVALLLIAALLIAWWRREAVDIPVEAVAAYAKAWRAARPRAPRRFRRAAGGVNSRRRGCVAASSPDRRARAGSVVDVEAGEYRGDLLIDRPIQLIGHGRPVLIGSGTGSVVRVRADDVRIEGFDIDGRGGGDLGRDSSGIHVAAARATIRDCRISRALFGMYLREAMEASSKGARSSVGGISPPAKRVRASTCSIPTGFT